MSQWGRWDDDLDPVTFLELTLAYQRRKQWEAELFAANIWNLLGKALSKKGDPLDLTDDVDAAADFIKSLGGLVD